MKKIILIVMALSIMLLVIGCASSPNQPITKPNDNNNNNNNNNNINQGDSVSADELNQQIDVGFEDQTSDLEIGEMI